MSVLLGVSLPDRYQPIRRIARGGMASVWCALDRRLDRQVAIKLLAEPFADDPLAGRRFMREARAAAHLSGHSNVVTIYDVGRASGDVVGTTSEGASLGRPFIVMEYLAGGTVADALRTAELDREVILRWLRQAASALDYAHSRGVIHRDVKLSNFLLDRDRVLHVADFGIARLGTEDTLSSSGQVLGTAAYLAPERALGLPATEASDRYALAVAAFELLVGERPFIADHFAAQARQHVEEPPPRASQRNHALPAALDRVLARGMAKHQDERFASARELVDAIEHALSRRRIMPSAVTGAELPTLVRARAPARGRGQAPDPVGVQAPAPVVYGRRGRGRVAALAALAAVLAAVAVAAGATLVPGSSHHRTAAQAARRYALHRNGQRRPPAAASDRNRPSTTSTNALAPPTTPPAPGPSPPASGPAAAAALEAEGHQLMADGNYRSAISVLRQAVASAPRSSLTYAYALYDLGRSLRLAGDPRAAVPILWQRLQIPNQTEVVRNELALALEALGRSAGGPSRHDQGPPQAGSGGGSQND